MSQAVAIHPQPRKALQASNALRQLLQLVVCQAQLLKGLHIAEEWSTSCAPRFIHILRALSKASANGAQGDK